MAEATTGAFRARDYLAPRNWPMWLAIGLLRIVALLPYRAALGLGRAFGLALMPLSARRRRIVELNLARCLPEQAPAERRRIARESFANLGVSLVEMAICWWWPARRLEPLVEIVGREHLDRALADGRGVILLTGHFTSLEIGARLLALFTPLQVMYRKQRSALFDAWQLSRRSRYFVDTVSRKNMRTLIRGIRRQLPTWYAPDQDFRRERNVFAPFMGIPTATLTATARMAEAANAVVLPYYPERRADGRGYVLHIAPPLADFPSGDDQADATLINRSIENWVHRFPGNYMWVHQRFKTRPRGEPRFYPR